jgi:integrase
VIPFLGGCRLAETDRTVARNYITVLEEEGRSANTIRQAKVVLCAMFGMAVADGYADYNPFHDVKIPKVPGRRAIMVATPEQYLTVRACLPNKPAQVFSTLLVSSGIRFCEAIGLRPADFDFEAAILEVARSVVKVARQHHPRGKTFLIRDYTKNGQTRRLKLDRAVVELELVRGHVAEHGISESEVIFPADLVVPPPRRTKPRLTEEQLRALGDCEPVNGRVYAHGTLGGYVTAKCRCEGVGSGHGTISASGCACSGPSPPARPGAGGRSLVIPTSPTLRRSSGIGSGPGRLRTAGFRLSRPLTRSGTRTPRG